MARRKRDGGGGEGASWMDTYGDLVTLLLCFFVLLYSFSTVDAKKWEALVGAFSGMTGLSAIPAMDLQTVVDAPIALEIDTSLADTPNDPAQPSKGNGTQDIEYFRALVGSLQGFIVKNGLKAELEEDQATLTVTLRINENILFDSGDATLKVESHVFLDDLADLFADQMHIISLINIEGHTDTDPIKNKLFEDNWDLSAKRATNTARYIMESNTDVEPIKIIPQGMGEYHPVLPNTSPEGKAANRRVDFVIQSFSSDTEADYLEDNDI